ncbi:S-methyl-5-thioribose-1-phosphate isomerase [uncultured Draconibacterium sp.]|uniref:S-methyl-5-thioribose-1-phosphate isomerase n=1 Tax=uncultured Draconibacterium sp. TaxID=1573823 RepID=UPI0025F65982|nr:S-methyl-5-thioribose-1-phosphate isomerase [uncultured Draconibacterium sp.]
MKIKGTHHHTIWINKTNPAIVEVIDQRKLPFCFEVFQLLTPGDAYFAIKEMVVRGAPLIGITAAYGMYLALFNLKTTNFEQEIRAVGNHLKTARPTAVNLAFAVDELLNFILENKNKKALTELVLAKVEALKQEEINFGAAIGEHGLKLIEAIYKKKGAVVNILTHCNAGWLACIDWGTATAPIYKAFLKGIPVHVWVDETRPRNQGARLTAYELGEQGVPHTVIPDNTGGHLMQHGKVDLVIVGSDRTTSTGDVANKIGTYLKALAAFDNKIPFYVALPSSTFDWEMTDGLKEIPIEERDGTEVAEIEGWHENELKSVNLIPENSKVANYGFDVTPARLVTALISERGICKANKKSISEMYPDKIKNKL